jgi:hypothetical protein
MWGCGGWWLARSGSCQGDDGPQSNPESKQAWLREIGGPLAVGDIETDEDSVVKRVIFENGDKMECSAISFAIGISPEMNLRGKLVSSVQTEAEGLLSIRILAQI